MKTKILSLILSFSFLLMSSYAFATTLSGSITIPGNDVNSNLTDQGIYLSPYGANVVIGNTSFQGNLACLDINLSTYEGGTYAGTWYTANSYTSIFPFANSSQYTALNEVGWLTNQLYGLTPWNTSSSVVAPIDLAIWAIMLPYSNNPSTSGDAALLSTLDSSTQALVNGLINSAATAVAGGYTTTDLFFSPYDTTSQGFVLLGPNPVNPTPEAPTFLLYGAGIVGVVYLKRKKNV